jgi:hypothetical protein
MQCSIGPVGLPNTRTPRWRQRVLAATAIAVAFPLAACGGDQSGSSASAEIEHIHGLGVNPADGALHIATHSGLFRSAEGSSEVERVGESTQDTMGFTVVGPDHFLGSGHPGPGESGAANLGLIESTDAGASWRVVSLAGEADFHVLRYAHERVYAYNGLSGELMLSDDGGESWQRRRPPAPLIDLAVDPTDPERIVASTEGGLGITEDQGRRWRHLDQEIGLLAWPEPSRLFLVDGSGGVQVSDDGGQSWRRLGNIGGQPAAFIAAGDEELYVALADGTVLNSADGGRSWNPRLSQ